MEKEEYERVFALEESHWWYVGMRQISLSVLQPALGKAHTPRTILDAGCGTGGMIKTLQAYGRVYGMDISPQALTLARQKGAREIFQARIENLPWPDGGFDLVTSFDVLYHQQVSNDLVALREFHRVLKPHGRILLRLAAYDWLRGRHDLAVHTRHRYTAGEVRDKMLQAGFTIERLSYANTILFPAAILKRIGEAILPDKGPSSDVSPLPPFLNNLLRQVLFWEASWLRRFDLPFGLSVIALGRKQG